MLSNVDAYMKRITVLLADDNGVCDASSEIYWNLSPILKSLAKRKTVVKR
jgi:hypothetical protein